MAAPTFSELCTRHPLAIIAIIIIIIVIIVTMSTWLSSTFIFVTMSIPSVYLLYWASTIGPLPSFLRNSFPFGRRLATSSRPFQTPPWIISIYTSITSASVLASSSASNQHHNQSRHLLLPFPNSPLNCDHHPQHQNNHRYRQFSMSISTSN